MAEAKKESVIAYFEDNLRREDAVEVARELNLDPSKLVCHKLGDKYVYGIEVDSPVGFGHRYQRDYVNKRSNENKAERRGQRCLVPGERSCLKMCPEDRSCKGCPNRDNKPTSISIEQSFETVGQDTLPDNSGLSILQRIELKETLTEAARILPAEVMAFCMLMEGYSKPEIQEEFKKSEATINRWIIKATNLMREIWFNS